MILNSHMQQYLPSILNFYSLHEDIFVLFCISKPFHNAKEPFLIFQLTRSDSKGKYLQ